MPEPVDSAASSQNEQPDAHPDHLLAPRNAKESGPVANDPAHAQNEVAGPDRGEFGRHAGGVTHGGYGGFQPGRKEGGAYSGPLGTPPPTTGYDGERSQQSAGFVDNSNGSFGSQPGQHAPANSTVSPGYANDNAAPQGTDSGFAPNYGTSSLTGATTATTAAPAAGQRNQTEDYRPNHPEQGPEGLTIGAAPTNAAHGHNEADTTPTGTQRSGYQAAGSPDAQGSEQTGFGSRGGSYNDEYDAASDAKGQGSPTRGDYSQQDAAQNYGGAAADRTSSDDSPDYGPAPTRATTPGQGK
ncbi:hypothetical protein [Hymenobacter weizhouensis]|uniref:hypothetical protein n=1 Tax=Hymenobacter sp. YIM 151500-1 TaxID=2987689 RepID=UPI002225B805|nr:hypothetical protein [Hymenobacter sp. YIM 151500-1]UYZ63080.1 hypothetical protein OIS53_19060 [Hymenobacter sp. YIM 151500-1]